jgi:inorganic pyrophosphatase
MDIKMEPFNSATGYLNVIIDTPKGSRNKFTYQDEHRMMSLTGILPIGASFPFDFGFIPSTAGGDGDPLDVLVLMDDPAFPGCLVPSRLIGVIEARQTENRKTNRNDRLIAIAAESIIHSNIKTLRDLNSNLIKQIEHFFISYNEIKGKRFEPLGRYGPARAVKVVKAATRQAPSNGARSTKKSAR